MTPFIRRILAVLGALAVAIVIVYAVERVAAGLNPLPPGADISDPRVLKRALEAGEVPVLALVLVLAGWVVAAYFGGSMAWRWSRESGAVWLFAIVFTLVIFRELAIFPHPTWMWVGGLGGTPLFALGGGNRSLAVRG
jgi:hypothetical protein